MKVEGVLNISHLYRGLIKRNRAYASFRNDELNIIYNDIKHHINSNDVIFDPMSGYGGAMQFFGKIGNSTYNVELNPPSYFWQKLINPQNEKEIIELIDSIIKDKSKFPNLTTNFIVIDELFSNEAIDHIKNLYKFIFSHQVSSNKDPELCISLLLPFVSRFANYVKSETSFTHFKPGGYNSFDNWGIDFIFYLNNIKAMIKNLAYENLKHINILGDISQVKINKKFRFLVTSPPYPIYRDYSKIFIIENTILSKVFGYSLDFNNMIGSNSVSGKKYSRLISNNAKLFLEQLLDKAEKLNAKAKADIISYYHPYFRLYFFQLQETLKNIFNCLEENSYGYIVVNDNITRDIIVPVGNSVSEISNLNGFTTKPINIDSVSHMGNINRNAKRINSHHQRHIIKIWN